MTEREPRGEGEREATPAAEGRTPAVTAVQIDQGTLLAIIAGVTARLRGEGPSRRAEERGSGDVTAATDPPVTAATGSGRRTATSLPAGMTATSQWGVRLDPWCLESGRANKPK